MQAPPVQSRVNTPSQNNKLKSLIKRRGYNLAFAIIFSIFQAIVLIFNGMFIKPTPVLSNNQLDQGLFTTVGVALLVLIGIKSFIKVLDFTLPTSRISCGLD
jgi:hypothetical protein